MARRKGAMIDLDGLFGLGAVSDIINNAKDIGIMGAGALTGIAGMRFVSSKVDFIRNQSSWLQGLIYAGVGVVGGTLLSKYVHRGVGAGFGAGLVGMGALRVGEHFLPSVFTPMQGLGATLIDTPQRYRSLAGATGMHGLGNALQNLPRAQPNITALVA